LDAEKNEVVTAMSIKMRAEIVSHNDGSLRGELHSQYFKKPFIFTSLVRMIEKMEKTFDTKGFPEKFMLPRTFSEEKPVRHRRGTDLIETVKEADAPEEPLAPGDRKCTFEISVRYRRNAEWQGQIHWIEQDKNFDFKSILEMLIMMSNALEGKNKINGV